MKLKEVLIINLIVLFAVSYSMTGRTLNFILYILAVATSFYFYYLDLARKTS